MAQLNGFNPHRRLATEKPLTVEDTMKPLLFAVLLTLSGTAQALFIPDYFHDTESGLDWLHGRYTQGLAYNQVNSVFGVAGGGWRTASVSDVHSLFDRLFPGYQANTSWGTFQPAGRLSPAQAAEVGRFQTLFGSVDCVFTGQCSYGLYADGGQARLIGTYFNPGDQAEIYGPGYINRFDPSQQNDLFYTFLVRGESGPASVPEPGPLALLAVGLLGLAVRQAVAAAAR